MCERNEAKAEPVKSGLCNEVALSEQGHAVDALAQAGDEGRGKLRKASGSRKQALIRGYPNGETWRG